VDFELSPEQVALRDQVAAFAKDEVAPLAETLDRECRFPTELYRKVGGMGITAIPFAEEFGGMGLGTFEMTLAIEQLARADQSLAVTTMVSVAAGLIVERFGTPAQKAEYLPAIVRGESYSASESSALESIRFMLKAKPTFSDVRLARLARGLADASSPARTAADLRVVSTVAV